MDTAACTDRTGKWVCSTHQPPKKVGLSINSSAPPTAWSVPFWAVDNQNVTGCASDSNTCTSATCGSTGVGPCLTWAQINDVRMGCGGGLVACPQINGSVVANWQVEFVSNDTVDQIFLYPSFYNGAQGEVFGGTPTGCTTTTLASVTAGGPPSRTALWLAAPTAGTFAAGYFITDATHPGAAWAYKVSSGSIWQLTQPEARTTNPPVVLSVPTELTTWANGDTVTYCPSQVTVNLIKTLPTQGNLNATAFAAWLNIHNLNDSGAGSASANDSSWQINSAVSLQEVSSQRPVYNLEGDFGYYTGDNNDYFVGGFGGWGDTLTPTTIWGGYIGTAFFQQYWFWLDGDVILNGTQQGHVFDEAWGAVYIATGAIKAHVYLDLSGISYTAPPVIWGPGTLIAKGRVGFVGTAVNIFKSPIVLDGLAGTHFCIGDPLATATTLTCNIALTAVNLDTNITGLGRCAGYVGSSSGYCSP